MSLIVKKTGSDFQITPAGMVQAVCYAVWDIGMQTVSFQGKEKQLHKGIIAWEINEKINQPDSEFHGCRFTVTNRYTLSLSDKALLRAHLESWRGKPFTLDELNGFDLETVVGANCMLNIVHNESGGKTYANIGAITPLLKNMPPMKAENNIQPPDWVLRLQDPGYQAMKKEEADPFAGPDGIPPHTDEDLNF